MLAVFLREAIKFGALAPFKVGGVLALIQRVHFSIVAGFRIVPRVAKKLHDAGIDAGPIIEPVDVGVHRVRFAVNGKRDFHVSAMVTHGAESSTWM